jgi:hypothetical protein
LNEISPYNLMSCAGTVFPLSLLELLNIKLTDVWHSQQNTAPVYTILKKRSVNKTGCVRVT